MAKASKVIEVMDVKSSAGTAAKQTLSQNMRAAQPHSTIVIFVELCFAFYVDAHLLNVYNVFQTLQGLQGLQTCPFMSTTHTITCVQHSLIAREGVSELPTPLRRHLRLQHGQGRAACDIQQHHQRPKRWSRRP